jgi:hypothetical protein
MHVRLLRSLAAVAAAALAVACGSTAPDGPGAPVLVAVTSGNAQTAAVGTPLASPLVVTVTDVQARPVPNVVVTWNIAQGNGAVSPATSTTDAEGQASATFTVGTQAGSNVVSASIAAAAKVAKFTFTVVPGPLANVTAGSHSLMLCGVDTGHVSASTFDQYGNAVSAPVVWETRNAAVATVDATGAVQLVSPTDSTYLVARSGTASPDSVQVKAASVLTLAAAQVDTMISGGSLCVGSSQQGSEFVLAAFLSSSTPGSSVDLTVRGMPLAALGSNANVVDRMATAVPGRAPLLDVHQDVAFEYALRERERRETPSHVAGARAWYAGVMRDRRAVRTLVPTTAPQPVTSGGAPVYEQIPATAAVGDLVHLNTNANAYCTAPIMTTGRIAAISNTAIVVADTSNPAGGFTDTEYAGFAASMDTLVMPVDTVAFGAPSDIDNNHRVVILFTKAVNQLTTDPSNGVVLGFYYSRDLLPQVSSTGNCPGSNQAEMFYLMVPDVGGTINGGNTISRSKRNVSNIVVGTIAHEFQHLINASRRMYVIHSPVVDEDTWLNEGLSHIAEELIFYRASGLGPRQNIGTTALSNQQVYNAFGLYMWGNQSRYQIFLPVVEAHGPIGEFTNDDDLSTRGAIWSFLRYLADQRPGDDSLFYHLVNSQTSGLANLQAVLGQDPLPLMRRWSLSVYANGTIPGIASAFDQPSWNWPQVYTLTNADHTQPVFHELSSSVPNTVTLKSDGGAYFPFAVANGTQALITVTGAGGTAPPASIKLTLIRAR